MFTFECKVLLYLIVIFNVFVGVGSFLEQKEEKQARQERFRRPKLIFSNETGSCLFELSHTLAEQSAATFLKFLSNKTTENCSGVANISSELIPHIPINPGNRSTLFFVNQDCKAKRTLQYNC